MDSLVLLDLRYIFSVTCSNFYLVVRSLSVFLSASVCEVRLTKLKYSLTSTVNSSSSSVLKKTLFWTEFVPWSHSLYHLE